MCDPVYEFTSNSPGRPPRKWLIAVLLCPLVAAAAWGISVLERKRTDALVEETFHLIPEPPGYPDSRIVTARRKVDEVRGEALRALAKYPHLQTIELGGTTAISGGLRSLPQFDGLRELSLSGSAWVDDEQIAWLGDLKSLERLSLNRTRVTDQALHTLHKLPRLSELAIEDCQGITDAGLEICAGMKQLKKLNLNRAGFSIGGLFGLWKCRRDLNLQWNFPDIRPPGSDISESPISIMFIGDDRLSQVESAEHNDESWTSIGLHGGAVGPWLEEFFPLAPKLAKLLLDETRVTTEDFPFESTPQGLRHLVLSNMTVSEAFLQRVSQHSSLETLRLSRVNVEDVDIRDPVWGHLTSLKSLELSYVTVDGAHLSDHALETIIVQLREQLPHTHVVVHSETSDGPIEIEWGIPVTAEDVNDLKSSQPSRRPME